MVSQQNSLFPAISRTAPLSNAEIALRLERGAELLESHAANPFRVTAYRQAAQTIRHLEIPLCTVAARLEKQRGTAGFVENGTCETRAERGIGECGIGNNKDGTCETFSEAKSGTNGTFLGKSASELLEAKLQTLPGIGESLAKTISTLVQTGQWGLLEELEKDSSYAAVFSTVPGIGAELADRIHAQLGIETLPELAAAAHDGRLSHVPGFGPKRLRGVRESLFGRLHLSARDLRKANRKSQDHPLPDEPPVSELLSIDEQYRRQVTEGVLPKVAPRKFNPTCAAWLPVLNTQRANRQYTAMYSNTARAHDLGTTKDWVVIHRSDQHGRGLWTVVTSTFGPHKGDRVVRGREEEGNPRVA